MVGRRRRGHAIRDLLTTANGTDPRVRRRTEVTGSVRSVGDGNAVMTVVATVAEAEESVGAKRRKRRTRRRRGTKATSVTVMTETMVTCARARVRKRTGRRR
jgi:hypothetical protein